MGFTYLRSKLQIFIPRCQRTLSWSSNNNVVPPYKGPSQRFIGRLLSQVNLRTLSSKIERIQRPLVETLVPNLLNLKPNGLMKKTLAHIVLHKSRASLVPLMAASKNSSKTHYTALVFYGSFALIFLVFGKIERVPYSDRNHLVLSNSFLESKLGNMLLERIKREHEGRTLPPNSKESIRVQTVMEKILEALNNGLRLENASISLKCSGGDDERVIKVGDEKVLTTTTTTTTQPRKRRRYGIEHLEKMKWELLVVDSFMVNACFIPSGKVVVFSGLLEKFKDELELATILAHEVGHGVARHVNEVTLIKWLVRFIIECLLLYLLEIDMPPELLKPVEYFFSRRREMEADYIGLMLMASAGYDPSLAPEVFTKLDISESDFLSTHPTGNKRRGKLQDPEVMGKAMAVYREVTDGLGLRSFI